MLLSEGALEILEYISESSIARFVHFKELTNSRTGKVFSANTLSARLKELTAAGAIENIVVASPKQRKLVGYRLTPAGKKALELAREYEEKLGRVLKAD